MAKIYTLKVYPEGMERTAYRTIIIGGQKTLDYLCATILAAFDFFHEHLYEFCINNEMYSEDNLVFDGEPENRATAIKIDKMNLIKGQIFSLHYDFGDDWMFTIAVQHIVEGDTLRTPRIIKAKGKVEQYPDWDGEE